MQPLSQRIRQQKQIILTLYVVTLISFWGLILYTLQLEWRICLNEAKESLHHQASTTSELIHELLVDKTRILDSVRSALEKEFPVASHDRYRTHEIIQEVIQNLSVDIAAVPTERILFLDQDGILIAQNGVYPTPAYDLTERPYFRNLRDDPSRKFALGMMRKSITTGQWAFHISMPVHDAHQGFAGVIVYQINEQEVDDALDLVLKGFNNHLLVQNSSGLTTVIYPFPSPTLPLPESPLNAEIFRLIQEQGDEMGTVRISEGKKGASLVMAMADFGIFTALSKSSEATHVGYVKDPLFGSITTARAPESDIMRDFFSQNKSRLGVILLIFLTTNILFYGYYRKSLFLMMSRSDSSLDPLTHIRNRRSFEKEFHRLWLDAVRRKIPITLFFIDIDHFKELNDLYSHAAGDRVIRSAAAVIERSLCRPLDLSCRWGGDEFLAVLPETTEEVALSVAERIRHCFSIMKLKLNGRSLPPSTLSVGIASFDPQAHVHTDREWTPETLIARADKALLKAKASGRNQIVLD